MISIIHPSLPAFLVGLFVLLFYRKSFNYLALMSALISFVICLTLEPGLYEGLKLANYEVFVLKVDKLSLFFSYVFSAIGFLGLLYALKVEDRIQIGSALMYMGCALGIVFAYDLLSFYLFWEGLAVCAVMLIISARTKEAYFSSIRYILVHAASGLSLFSGFIILSLYYGISNIENLKAIAYTLPYFLVLLAFVINAAVPPFNAWLPDSYPNATIYGSVFLSAFTTKSAVYALVRVFPGEQILAIAGALMAFYGVVFATLENNPRRLLSYHIISQVGFMVCGAGLGSLEALNGASAHAFAHIIYKGLLFMSAGAVIYATGIERIHLLGGLARKNPWIALYFFIGGLSISGVPLTSGFVSKSITLHAASLLHRPLEYLLMEMASVGTFFSIVLKMGYFIFFNEPRSYEIKPIPWNMHLAMILASALCILIGILPQVYYQLLPYPIEYEPYTYKHTVGIISLFSATTFVFFMVKHVIAPKPKINLDTDWFYITGGRLLYKVLNKILELLEYRYIGEFYKTIIDKSFVCIRNKIKQFDELFLDIFNLNFPIKLVKLSNRISLFFDGQLIKYVQLFIIVLCIFYLIILLTSF